MVAAVLYGQLNAFAFFVDSVPLSDIFDGSFKNVLGYVHARLALRRLQLAVCLFKISANHRLPVFYSFKILTDTCKVCKSF